MGEIQLEVLQSLMKSRFNMDISFSQGGILYKETIANKVEGVGHYEPLRHYAEVHLILEPLKRGSGLVLRQNVLKTSWIRIGSGLYLRTLWKNTYWRTHRFTYN